MSIPANDRIAEIKRIMFENSLLNTNITDLDIIKQVIFKVLQSSNEEVLLFFPTINSFWLIEESIGIIKLLGDAINKYINVKVIIHNDSQYPNANKIIDQKKRLYF